MITHRNFDLQLGSSQWHVLPVETDTLHSLILSISMRIFVAGGSHQTSVKEDDNHYYFSPAKGRLSCTRMVTCSRFYRPLGLVLEISDDMRALDTTLPSSYVTSGWLEFSLQG